MNAVVDSLPRGIRVEMFPGIDVDLDLSDATMRASFWRGPRFEKPTGQILEFWCSKSAAFFDMGSNYGFFSFWMASKLKNLEIYPFEPNPKTFERLNNTVTSNCLNRVHPQHLGLSDKNGVLPLHIGKTDSGHTTFGSHPELTQVIDGISLMAFDEWRKSEGIHLPQSPSWVAKIDVEGFELNLLKGMADTLKARAFRGICIELNDFTLKFCNTTPQEVVEFIHDHGYKYSSVLSLDEQKLSGNGFFEPA